MEAAPSAAGIAPVFGATDRAAGGSVARVNASVIFIPHSTLSGAYGTTVMVEVRQFCSQNGLEVVGEGTVRPSHDALSRYYFAGKDRARRVGLGLMRFDGKERGVEALGREALQRRLAENAGTDCAFMVVAGPDAVRKASEFRSVYYIDSGAAQRALTETPASEGEASSDLVALTGNGPEYYVRAYFSRESGLGALERPR